MFSQLFAVAALAVSAQSVVAATQCSRSYTIQAGDYCDKISQAQNVSTYQLAVSNTGKYKADCTDLKIGGELCLALKPEEDCKTTYVVSPGDTCLKVASNHQLNTTILYLNNPQIDETCSNIYIGEVLCVSNTVQVSAIPSGGVVVPAPGASSTVLSTTPISRPTASVTAIAAPAATTTAKAVAANNNNNKGADDDDTCDDDDSSSDNTKNNSGSNNDNDDDCDDDSADDDNDDDLPFCDEL